MLHEVGHCHCGATHTPAELSHQARQMVAAQDAVVYWNRRAQEYLGRAEAAEAVAVRVQQENAVLRAALRKVRRLCRGL